MHVEPIFIYCIYSIPILYIQYTYINMLLTEREIRTVRYEGPFPKCDWPKKILQKNFSTFNNGIFGKISIRGDFS